MLTHETRVAIIQLFNRTNDRELTDMTRNKDTILVSLEPDMTLIIRPPYDPSLADHLHHIPRCFYEPKLKAWSVGIGRMAPEAGLNVYHKILSEFKPKAEAKGYGVKFNKQASQHARQLAELAKTFDSDFFNRISPVWEKSLAGHGVSPYQHQLDAVKVWLGAKGRGVFGHEMGTGKTIASILACHAIAPRHVIIFTPASIKAQWREALTMLHGYEVFDYDGKTLPETEGRTALLVSYALAHKLQGQCRAYGYEPEMLVCDECHYVKNPKAERTKAVIKLAQKVPYFLALSGTPIVNRPVDLFPLLKVCNPTEFNDWYRFTRMYCNGHQGKFGYVCDGLSKADELHKKLSTVMHRVRKEDCLDLPDKTRVVIPIDHFNNTTWVDQYYALREQIADGEAHFATLRKFIALNKIKSAVDWIVDFLDASPDQKLVVFAHHVEVVKEIIDEVNRRGGAKSDHKPLAVGFTGETPAGLRDKMVTRFRNKDNKYPVRVLVSTLGSGGTGLNLQVASQMLVVESSYSPGEMLQAEDRIHRSGQTRQCTIHYMIEHGTYDRVLYRLLTKKMDMMNAVIDGDTDGDLNVFGDLMKEIKAA